MKPKMTPINSGAETTIRTRKVTKDSLGKMPSDTAQTN
jgi:hypothetical protein